MIVDVPEAARRIDAGEVVAYPTETVYGLGADARSAHALNRVSILKARDPRQALSVLVADLERLLGWVPDISPGARRLAERFWPGPLTLVLPTSDPSFEHVRSEFGVGFRCSSGPVAAELARLCASPVISTSCNRSGTRPCRDPEAVQALFGIDLPIVGTAVISEAAPSTVVAVDRDGKPKLLREGELLYAAILEALAA